MTWSWKLTDEQRDGLTTRQFVRRQLLRLGLGHDLTHILRGGGKYLIARPDGGAATQTGTATRDLSKALARTEQEIK